MSDEYSERFLRPNRPNCFGDVQTYDSRDSQCQGCPVRGSCSVQVNRKIDAETRTRREGVSPTSVVVRKDSTVDRDRPRYEVEDADDVTWFEALGHNGMLGMAETMARELVEGIRTIPRWKYPNPFHRRKRE